MEARRVAAGDGWQWLVCGWQVFVKNPAIMVLYVLFWLGISIVLGLIPVVGGLAMALITPVLLAGWYEAAHRLQAGETIGAGTLFEGFRRGEKTAPLVTLGAILLVGQILIMLIVMAFIGGAVMGLREGMEHMGSLETVPELALTGGMGLGMLLAVLGGTLLLMAYIYAVPLVWFGEVRPVAALKSSFAASLQNFLPLLILGVIYLILVPIALLPFGLGMLVLVPVTVCAVYCSYRSIYPDTEGGAADSETNVVVRG